MKFGFDKISVLTEILKKIFGFPFAHVTRNT